MIPSFDHNQSSLDYEIFQESHPTGLLDEFLINFIKKIKECKTENSISLLKSDPLLATRTLSLEKINFIASEVKNILENNNFNLFCKLLVEKSGGNFAFRDLDGIKEENIRIEYAKRTPKISGRIKLFKITDQAALVEIAKIDAARNGCLISAYIQNYDIKDEAALVEIAKIAAVEDGEGTSQYIKNYGIKDQDALIEIAKIAAANFEFSGISLHIRNYDIKDQNALIDIAKTEAENHPSRSSEYFRNYNIKDQKILIEIAKITAKKEGNRISQHIQNYDIKDKDVLVEIAKIAAAQDEGKTSEHIRCYGIEDQDVLIEIAKISLLQDAWAVSKYISRYGIKDKNMLIEIAKISAAQDGKGTSKNIQNYGIKDKGALIEISKIAAAQDGGKTSEYIQNYDIEDKGALIEIAKIAAAQDGGKTSEYIQNYGIENKDALIEIAKIAAAQDGRGTSRNIQSYGIKDKGILVEIAKVAAAQDGEGTSKKIQSYDIKDKGMLVEIAKVAAAQDGEGTSKNIQNYGVKDKNMLVEIANIALRQNLFGAICQIHRYNLKVPLVGVNLIESRPSSEEIEGILRQIMADDPSLEPLISLIMSKLSGEKNPQVIEKLTQTLGAFLFLCKFKRVPEIRLAKGWTLLEASLNLRDPALRQSLLWELTECLAHKEVWGRYQQMVKKVKNFALLPCMLLAPYLGKDQEQIKSIQNICTNKRFKDKLATRSFIQNLQRFVHADQLSSGEKTAVFEKLIFKNEHKAEMVAKTLQIAAIITDLKEANSLLGIQDMETLLSIAGNFFEKKLNLVEEVKDIGNKLEKSFLKQRQPFAILRYAADLKRLPPQQSRCFDLLKQFAGCVLKGEFPAVRYEVKESPHLTLLQKKCPGILTKWQQHFDLSACLADKESKQQQDLGDKFQEIFSTKILRDHHLDVKEYPFVKDFLEQSVEKAGAIAAISERLIELGKEIPALKKAGNKEEYRQLGLERLRLESEKRLLLLFKTGLEKEKAVLILKELNRYLGKIYPERPPELIADIEGMVKNLTAEKQQSKLALVLTDDFTDLLLAGTEVAGSCQRIGGDPELNKCLLAYLMDGKNRMIALKNEDGEIIGRSILRLLWDRQVEKPLLFFERIYPDLLNDQLKELLQRGAAEVAKQLGIPLLLIKQSGDNYPGSVVSLGGIAPYEYVDAAEEIADGSYFEIQGAKLADDFF